MIETKESTATEWLMSGGFDGEFPSNLLTEYPEAIRKEIIKQLRETFTEDYWQDINKTTRNDIHKYLREGIVDGESIPNLAKKIMDAFPATYSRSRATNVARTESGNALNGARRAAMDSVISEMPEEVGKYMRPEWLSVLGTTTRPTHANLDGVPADKDGMWMLAGYRIPWPGHRKLPASERCNCQCTTVLQVGYSETEALQQIQEYNQRVAEEEKSVKVFCPTGSGGGVDPTCSPSGGSGGKEIKSLDSFRDLLEKDKYGDAVGLKDIGAVKTEVYRVGHLEYKKRGGTFFAGTKAGVEDYEDLHEGHQVKKYKFDLKNVILAGHQDDLTQAWFKESYADMMFSYRNRNEVAASAAFDKKLLNEAKNRGYDGVILLSPAPPAGAELGVVGDPTKKLMKD